MEFSKWLNESTVNDLYNSAVDAFPKTTLRQHAIDPIRITQLSIVPFKGMKTLYFKGLAQNEQRQYNPVILFKGVEYQSAKLPNTIQITADDGLVYNLNKLTTTNEVAVRCDCLDFYYRWNFTDWQDKSLYGRKRAKYESLGVGPPVNPTNSKGICKHLIKLIYAIKDSELLTI